VQRTTLLRVALTGGIATGKSYCLGVFAKLGAPTIDADLLAREAVEPGSPALEAVVERFGISFLTQTGHLNREALGRIVFADPRARRDLEAIIHPIVYEQITRWFEELRRDPAIVAGIADIPLLFETGHEGDFDAIVATTCTEDLQINRLIARGMGEPEALLRLESQLPSADKAARATYVIDTSESFAETDAQVRRVWRQITAAAVLH
jgi:dephospho-CoA kinase